MTGPNRPAAGARRPAAPPAPRGFTLLEVLVVTVIVGIVVAAAALSVGAFGPDRELERTARRVAALVELAAEEAVIQGRELGLELYRGGYRFSVYEPRERTWVALANDRQLRARPLPEGLEAALFLEGRRAALAQQPDATPRPQILLPSDGQATPFRLELRRRGGDALVLVVEASGAWRLERDGEPLP